MNKWEDLLSFEISQSYKDFSYFQIIQLIYHNQNPNKMSSIRVNKLTLNFHAKERAQEQSYSETFGEDKEQRGRGHFANNETQYPPCLKHSKKTTRTAQTMDGKLYKISRQFTGNETQVDNKHSQYPESGNYKLK